MSASSGSVFSWKSRLALSVGLLVLGSSGARGANPLPGVTIQNVKPVVVLLLDYSGSMQSNCDAAPIGDLVPLADLRQNLAIPSGTVGHFLFDPRENTADDVSGFGSPCDNDSSTTDNERGGISVGADHTDTTTAFPINRFEALKLAVSNILDATGDGVIDGADELVLDVHLGIASFSDSFTTGSYAMRIEAPIGTDFATAWNNIKNDVAGGYTPTGSALAGVRATMMEPCYDGLIGTQCGASAPRPISAELAGNGDDASLSCRSYFIINVTDGEPTAGAATNVNLGVNEDPVRVAYALKNKLRVLGTEVLPPVEVKVIAIGLGADVDDLDSDARGSINCTTYFSGADANYDGDNNPLTMQSGVSFPNFQDAEDMSDNNGSPSVMTVTLPTHATGDILAVMVNLADLNDVVTAPVGWTALANTPFSGTTGKYFVFWKRAGAVTEPSPAITRTLVMPNGGNMVTAAVSFRGAKSSGDPWSVVGTPSTGTAYRGPITGLTTTTSNSLVVGFVMNNDDKRTDMFISSLATWTEQYDQENDNNSPDYGMHVWTALKSTVGNIGNTTSAECSLTANAACVKFSGSNPWGGILAALTSGASGGPTLVGTSCTTSDNAGMPAGFDDDAYSGSTCVGPDFVCGVGNGYFASNADSIGDAVKDAFAFATTGSFSGSQPTVQFNVGGLSAGNVVYATFFDVVPNQFLWRGHLRKYRYNAALLPAADYVDCDNPAVAVSVPEACWDAAGWHSGSLYQVVNTAGFTVREETGTISHHGLAERHWSTRRIFSVNPQNITYNRDVTVEQSTRPTLVPNGTQVRRSIKGVVAALMAGTGVPYPPSTGDVALDTSGDLLRWITMASMSSTTQTHNLTDTAATLGTTKVTNALKAFMFAAGRPTSRYADDITQRCPLAPSCTDSVPTMKLMDSYHSRPVLVGPPAGVSTDPTYIGTFFEQALAASAYSASPFREDVVEYNVNQYVLTSNGTPGVASIADPCAGVVPCKVKTRRKMVYTGGNDGMMHAFDEKSGHELWAFIPPSNLRRLKEMRADRAVYVDGAFSVRDVKFRSTAQNFADGNWHTVLISSQGLGGNFYFAMDITNPVDPTFLWEYRRPANLGNTVPRAVIGEIIAPTTGTTDANPGSVVFAAGGSIPTSVNHFFTLHVNTGLRLYSAATSPSDLVSASTAPVGIPNSMIGEPRAVDANLDGKIDRVYFGDAEGRLWKACNILMDGTFTLEMFFDPATYDTAAPGQPIAGNTADPTNNVVTTTVKVPAGGTAADRKTLRGPIYFPADVTHDGNGRLIVAFGSGNVFDPLTAPAGYNNFIWMAEDNEAGGAASCGAPLASRCAGATADNRFTAAASTFNGVLPVDKLLTGPPLILNNYLIYPEFERLGTVSSCTASAFESRIVARDMTCGIPGVLPFRDSSNNPTNVITYQNTLVTGIQVDPRSGTLFAQTSTGSGPPAATNVPALQARQSILGFRLQ